MSSVVDWLREMVEHNNVRHEADAKRWDEIDRNLCMLCGAYGMDKRSLFVDCLYAVYEVVPEVIDLHKISVPQGGFYLLICKNCRADFLTMMGEWRDRRVARRGTPMDHDGATQWEEEQEAESVQN